MTEIAAQTQLLQYRKEPGAHLICVPSAIQFLLPEQFNIPSEIYKSIIASDGIAPSELLRSLEACGWITFTQHSITHQEFISGAAAEMKDILDREELLGIGLSITPTSDSPHFITIKGPMRSYR